MSRRGRKSNLTVELHEMRRIARRVVGQRFRPRVETKSELSLEEWQHIVAQWDGRCAYCGYRPTGYGRDVLQIDHVEPLCRGGRNTAHNAVPACYVCNASKIDFLLLEWVCRQAGVLRGRSYASLRVG